MTSFVNWLVAGLSPLLLATRAGSEPVSRPLAARVSDRIADSWRVPGEQVRLAWGRSSRPDSPPSDAPFRLLGRGDAGWFVVVFEPAETTACAIRVRAGVERLVLTAARPLSAGGILKPDDLREEVRVRWGMPSPDTSVTPAAGWEVRRSLKAGDVVEPPAVVVAPMVLAGQPLRFEWRRGGVEVSMVGIALNSARRGETVRARLEDRPARVTGTVTAPGLAVLQGGLRR